MLCQYCNENDATIHFTKIINGDVEEKHLCENCAKSNNNFDFDFPFPFHKLFTSLLETPHQSALEKQEFKNINCPRCGLDHRQFMETGKFGCAKCYEVFNNEIDILLKNIHGHSRHIGKIPSRSEEGILQKREIESLKRELDENIRTENFEQAAVIRDKIRQINEKAEAEER